MPTPEQMLACIQACQALSNFYLDIHLFRFDAQREEVYILAGETIGLTIFKNGLWEFDNDTEV
ncbi:MAG: hypothetical protein F6K47_44130 [Symploca sp. SIO2E6]|nr:hypothetical protein [Symploca sp. SIO2E6]